jgi:hypothetical protein
MLNSRMLHVNRPYPEMYFLPSYINCLKACLRACLSENARRQASHRQACMQMHRQEGNPEYRFQRETF